MLRWAFILLVLSFHNFIDFFSFSRGYGMSLTMLSGSILFTMKALRFNRTSDYMYALSFMLFSVSAILILVNSYIVIIGLLALNAIFHYPDSAKKMFRHLLILVFLGVIPVILVVEYLFDLNQVGRLDYGGMEGFWDVSVKSLTGLLLDSFSRYLNGYILVLLPILFILYFYLLNKKNGKKRIGKFLNPKFIFFYLLVGNVFGFFLENKIFGILYPEERTSIQFILFFSGSLIFFLDETDPKFKTYRIVPLLPFLLLPVHFFYSVNLNFSKVDTSNFNIPDSFYQTVRSHQKDGDFPPTVQAYQLRIMRWNMHNFIKKGEQSCIHSTGYPQLDGDFQIVYPDENPRWATYYDTVDVEKLSGAALLKRRNFLKKHELYFTDSISFRSSDEFQVISEGIVDSLPGTSLFFGFKVNLTTDAKPFHSWIVVEIRNHDDKAIRYEYIPFDWYRTTWEPGNKTFVNGLLVHELPGDSKKYVAYIWNIYKEPYSIDDSEFYVYRLEKDY